MNRGIKINLENKDAIVLHHYDYRNTSLIIHFFLRDFGKISAVAKGVKKSKKNYFSLLQPFQSLTVSLTGTLSGESELLLLKNVESTPVNWKLSGKPLYCAYYINEILLRLLPSQSDCHDIFDLYHEVLGLLTQCTQHDAILYEVPLRLFELKILEFLGYGLNLDYDIRSGSAIEANKLYHYIFQSGPSEYRPTDSASDSDSLIISGSTLINLANNELRDRKTLHESKQLLKWALAEHLGNKPLKSRELFKQLYCSR